MKQVLQQLIDDVDGSPADETIRFALDGRDYSIDLNTKNGYELRMALDPYIGKGRRIAGSAPAVRRQQSATGGEADVRRQVREWANRNGLDVAPQGRISERVMAAWATRDQATTTAKVQPAPKATRPAALDEPAATETVTASADPPAEGRRKLYRGAKTTKPGAGKPRGSAGKPGGTKPRGAAGKASSTG